MYIIIFILEDSVKPHFCDKIFVTKDFNFSTFEYLYPNINQFENQFFITIIIIIYLE